ncbi:MAG TPA: hypothetical protein VGQ49_22870 [Bryobacteraceae bacterium]|jgi:hypothetical protein|nr:hypothetical protein [Bryobacteraceae bacterium]
MPNPRKVAAKGGEPIAQEDIKNTNLVPVYSNNFQMVGGQVDVWLCFNEINPTSFSGGKMDIERRASVVVTVPQFFAMLNIMNEQARKLQESMRAAMAAQNKPTTAP